jgi:hypothetical protein
MKLWLDDIREAPEGWVHFTSPWKALEAILRLGDKIEAWSLDHDLGENVPTGYDFLCMIELLLAQGLEVHIPAEVYIHSANPVGRDNMLGALGSIAKLSPPA